MITRSDKNKGICFVFTAGKGFSIRNKCLGRKTWSTRGISTLQEEFLSFKWFILIVITKTKAKDFFKDRYFGIQAN